VSGSNPEIGTDKLVVVIDVLVLNEGLVDIVIVYPVAPIEDV
jgi:hypothetical protein